MPLVDPPVECDARRVFCRRGHIILELHTYTHTCTDTHTHSCRAGSTHCPHLFTSLHRPRSLSLLSPLFSVLVFLLSSLTSLAKLSVCFYSNSSLSPHLVDSKFQRECPISAVIQAEIKHSAHLVCEIGNI